MSISLRNMTTDDIELGMRLKTQAGWNQTPADWRRFLRLEPDGCFVAQWEGRRVATTTTCVFGSVGWIAMVLVDEEYRHRGIASQLVKHALEYLERRSVATVRLDATQFGQPVYQRLGFAADYELIRFQGRARPDSRASEDRSTSLENLIPLAELDQLATGTERARLIECLVSEAPQSLRLETRGEAVVGYAMFRPGANAAQIGPVVASTPPVGGDLCDWACGQVAGQMVLVDVPLRNQSAVQWAHSRGLTEQRRFTRMHRGDPIDERIEILWASSGAEKG